MKTPETEDFQDLLDNLNYPGHWPYTLSQKDGNVTIAWECPDDNDHKPGTYNVAEIVPHVGTSASHFTRQTAQVIHQTLNEIKELPLSCNDQQEAEACRAWFQPYLATEDYNDMMHQLGQIPYRVGYFIYPGQWVDRVIEFLSGLGFKINY